MYTKKDEEQIAKYMTLLKLTREEAIDCLEYDKAVDRMSMKELNETMTPEEKKVVSDMTRADRTQKAVNAYGKTVTREKKIDDDKVFLVQNIVNTLQNLNECENIDLTNTQREVNFLFKGKKYKIVLSAPRS